MLKNYFKIALRNIYRHKGYSFINIAGLAIGMVCSILIMLWVIDEWNYDRFHANEAYLYRIVTEAHYTDETSHFAYTPAMLASALKEEMPEIKDACRLAMLRQRLMKHGQNSYYENGLGAADPSFFDMFTFPFIRGSPESAFPELHSIVITEALAIKYFGDKNPIGRHMQLDDLNLKVTGVIENIPQNSHIQFDALLPFELLISLGAPTHWGGHSYRTYVLLEPGASHHQINQTLPAWTEAHTPEPVIYYLQSLTDIHLHYDGAITYIYIFSVIAAFILIIACINFMNLSTARSATRAPEVGLRKVIGAGRTDLIRQFFGESMLLTIIAFIMAIILSELMLPAFNTLTGKQFSLSISNNIITLSGLVLIVLLTGIISGSYPAFFLSSFRPVRILRGTWKSGSAGLWFRRILVVVQFSLSIILIVGTIVVHNQIKYANNKSLGFNKEHLISIPIRGDLQQKYLSFKSELLQNRAIAGVTAGSGMPGGPIDGEWGQLDWEGKDPNLVTYMYHYSIDHNYIKTFGMKIIQGRDFSADISSDTLNFILNEAAVLATGLESPVGKRFTLLYRTGTIIGVAKDFHTFSMHHDIGPVILRMMPPENWRYIFVRLKPGFSNINSAVQFIENTWNRFLPEFPFEYSFLDENFSESYSNELRMGKILNYGTMMGVLIACLGIFGLVSYAAEQRTKEIGIRKVLGASVLHIVAMLTREIIMLGLIANLVAWPLAWYAMNRWLEDFAYRINLGWAPFVIAALLSVAVALMTVSYQSVKSALSDPVKTLRYE